MHIKLTKQFARKGAAVWLRKDLPLGFGNKDVIKSTDNRPRKGYIESEGFENGIVKVHFPLYDGDQHVSFNADSALEYLTIDHL